MSQNTSPLPIQSNAGTSDEVKLEEDIIKTIQDWHVILKSKVLGLVTGGCLVLQPSDDPSSQNTDAHYVPFASKPTQLSENFNHPRSSYFQTMDTPGFVQHTLSFIISELHCELDQSRQRISQQRNVMRRHYAYLAQCRLVAEKEKNAAQSLLSGSISSLQTAERERERFANERIIAFQELRFAIRRRQLKLQASVSERSVSMSSLASCSNLSESSVAGSCDLLLVPRNHGHRPLTPPRTPLDTDIECESDRVVDTLAISEPYSELPSIDLKPTQCASSGDVNSPFQAAKGDTLQNPIGPYIRPPMSIEDMQRCIRCLLGKDKSLKTGNRARAFLGVPWSVIVSWDPDVLLQRGICGIKLGSTGMASRLRMMTIIESALANQGNDVRLCSYTV